MSSGSNSKIVRLAKKAGSWYEASPSVLDGQLTDWLNQAGEPEFHPAKAIISPHAGYLHCGSCAAHAYKEISPETSKIFILGPSHRVRLNGIALSPASIYQTPIGDLVIDKAIYDELHATQLFEEMSLYTDEEEHSIELQLPYIAKVMKKRSQPFTIVPMMVGSLSPAKEEAFGKVLSKYLADPSTTFVISSDFCHWGKRFDYQYYDKSWGEVWQSIEKLDKLGMKAIKDLDLKSFNHYLRCYGNTICGRYPIAVLLAAIEYLNKEAMVDNEKPMYNVKFLNYLQSSKCHNMRDSSVSYVAASFKEVSNTTHLEAVNDIVDV